ncbi:hypothetical protein D3C87_2076570 [compost metagenome]
MVRSQEHLGAQECGGADVFHEVVVPADEDSDPDAPGSVEDRKVRAAVDGLVFESMNFSVRVSGAVG